MTGYIIIPKTNIEIELAIDDRDESNFRKLIDNNKNGIYIPQIEFIEE